MSTTADGSRLLAHGIGGRSDLPIPFSFVLIAAAGAIVVSFVVLAWRWPTPRIDGGRAGRALPRDVGALLESRGWRWGWRTAGLLATAYIGLAAFGGRDDALNPTAGTVYVLFWVGTLVVASTLLGSVWRALNPLRTLQYLLFAAFRRDHRKGLLGEYPPALGYWPAALALLSFVWLELVGPERDSTVTLRLWFVAYAVIHLLGAVAFGSRWFSRADGFEVYSTMFGRLSVLGRRDDGVRVLRSPLAGLDQLQPAPGLVALVAVMLGSTAYDGVTQGEWWIRFQQNLQGDGGISKVTTGTVGLLTMVTIVAVTFAIACRLTGVLAGAGNPTPGWGAQFAPSLVPIALGYVLAHYYSLLVLVGQQTLAALSDPLGTGADLLGTGYWVVSYAWVGATLTATLQILFVIGGHLVGIVLAHDRAVRLLPRRHAVIGQVPLVIVMVLYTLIGLLLLFSS